MRKRIMLGFALVAILLAAVSCASPFEKYAEEPLVITFIETTDVHGSVFPYVTSFLALPMLVLETYLVLVCFVIMYNGTEVSNEDIKIALNETERKIDKLPMAIQSSIVSALQGMLPGGNTGVDSESHGSGAKPTYSPNAPATTSKKSAYFGNGNKNK